jgi:hypothetical protein
MGPDSQPALRLVPGQVVRTLEGEEMKVAALAVIVLFVLCAIIFMWVSGK